METQDHQTAIQSGHEGHSGVHVCHKCGWPFPNPHPSARLRRAHKKVCGTIEGYKLDISQDKTHVDGPDDEHVSDDDHKIISDKVMESMISRKSSSGFGSRSSRSTRSEDEVFADAVTEFVDSMASEDGVILRGNSLQNTTRIGPEGSGLSAENAIADDSSVTSVALEDKQLWAFQTFEGKNEQVEVKAGVPSQDQIPGSINSCLISASLTSEKEKAVEHNLMQSSGTSKGQDTSDEKCKEIAKNDNLSELKIARSETVDEVSEQVSPLRGVSEELSDSISFGVKVNLARLQSTGLHDRDECSSTTDSPPIHEVDSAGGNPTKSHDMADEHDPKIKANEIVTISDVFSLQEHPKIAVEDLDRKGGKFNPSLTVEAPSAGGSTEDMLKQEVWQTRPAVEQETVGGLDQVSNLKASYGDINGLRGEEALEEIRDEAWEDEGGSKEEQKSIVSLEKVFPEVTTSNGIHDQGPSTRGCANAIDIVKDEGKTLNIYKNNSGQVPVTELCVTSSIMAECSVDDIAPQDEKLMNAVDGDDVGNAEKVGVKEMTVSISEVKDQEVSSSKEQKSIVSSEKVFPEIVTTDGIHDQGTSTYGGARAIDSVKDDREYLVIREKDGSKVLVGESSVTSSTLAVCFVDDIAPQVKTLMDANDSNDVGEVETARVNEMTVGLEDKNEPLSTESIESSEDNNEPIKSPRTHDHDKLDKILDCGNLMAGHSHQESRLSPEGILREIQNAGGIVGGGVCTDKVGTGGVVKTDDSLDSTLKMSDDGGSFCPSSPTVLGSCTEKLAEHASDVTKSGKITKQHIDFSPAVDIMDSNGQTESQKSYSQSISVPSATKTDASNSYEASAQPAAIILEPKAMEKIRYPESKTTIEPLGLEKTEFTSEIETSENQKQTAALKTLLGEAIAKSRAESPDYDEIPVKNAKSEEMGEEWNSPARYPVKIKTEKRRAKGRSSYWVPFLCCSSVNANGP